MASEDIKITGILVDQVGAPRDDGTRGSGLYEVPLGLSATPSNTWARLFVSTWDAPPHFTTMHRPGIARVVGNRIVLDGTTVEEVEQYHAETLRSVLEKVNADAAKLDEAERARKQRTSTAKEAHMKAVREVAARVNFDT